MKIPSEWARAKLKERIVEDMSRIQALVSSATIRGRRSPPPLVWVHDGVKQAGVPSFAWACPCQGSGNRMA